MKVGYAGGRSEDQNLHLQKDALKEAGCERIFEEKVKQLIEDPETLLLEG
jgi:DNA invertase Pin-like site-specific DNA recombinase